MRTKGMKLLSKIVAACFVLILTVSMGVPVQAEIGEKETHKITVTGKETDAGATVDVYKMINVNYDHKKQQLVEPAYTWADSIATWMKEQEDFKEYVEEKNEVSDSFNEKVSAEKLSKLMRELKDAIVNGDVKLDKTASQKMGTESPFQVVFDGLEMGQYLIVTTPDAEGQYKDYEYAPATANILPIYDESKKEWFAYDADVTVKGSPAKIEKDVDDHTVAIGQEVNYTLNVPVPYYPSDATAELFRIGDKLPIGVTFEQKYEKNLLTVVAVYENGETQTIGTSEKDVDAFDLYYDAKDYGPGGVEGTQVKESDKTLYHEATFLLDFKYDTLMEQYGTYEDSPLKSIKVTYKGTINENAILRPEDPGYPGTDPLENIAYVGQNNDPYDHNSYKPTEDKEKLYTYEIDVTKVSKEEQKPLGGAHFELLKDDKTTAIGFVKEEDGKYRVAKPEEQGVTDLEVTSLGKLYLKGLATGTYYLKETKAPGGYEILEELIPVVITDKEADDKSYDYGKNPIEGAGIVDNGGDVESGSTLTNIVYTTVTNRKPPIMPITGGIGTVIFSVVGIALVAGGIMLIAGYQRRKRA